MAAKHGPSRLTERRATSVSFSRERDEINVTDNDDDDDMQISLAPHIQAYLAHSSQRVQVCGILVPVPFERAARSSWWSPRFDSEVLENQYQASAFPQIRLRFRYCLLYMCLVSLTWCVYLMSGGVSSQPVGVASQPEGVASQQVGVAYGLFTLASCLVLVSTGLARFQQLHRLVALLATLLMYGLSLYGATPLSPASQLALCVQIIMLVYTVVPLPLYACVLLNAGYSAAVEWVATATGTGSGTGSGWLPRLLCHCAVHIVGVHTLVMTDVRMRGTFMKVGQSLLVRRQLELEKQLKEKMIHSVMPPKVAAWLMSEAGRSRRESRRSRDDSVGTESDSSDTECDSESDSSDIHSLFRPFNMMQMENVSILFADIVGFTRMSSSKTAAELVALLNDLFERFDDVCAATGCEKISTLGDCYYCVAGCPEPRPDHAVCCIEMGLKMIVAIGEFERERGEEGAGVNMRVGVHTGTVLCGIVGSRRVKFDVWSNDVRLANKMESTGQPGRVHLSQATRAFLGDRYLLEDGPLVEDLKTYFVRCRRDEWQLQRAEERVEATPPFTVAASLPPLVPVVCSRPSTPTTPTAIPLSVHIKRSSLAEALCYSQTLAERPKRKSPRCRSPSLLASGDSSKASSLPSVFVVVDAEGDKRQSMVFVKRRSPGNPTVDCKYSKLATADVDQASIEAAHKLNDSGSLSRLRTPSPEVNLKTYFVRCRRDEWQLQRAEERVEATPPFTVAASLPPLVPVVCSRPSTPTTPTAIPLSVHISAPRWPRRSATRRRLPSDRNASRRGVARRRCWRRATVARRRRCLACLSSLTPRATSDSRWCCQTALARDPTVDCKYSKLATADVDQASIEAAHKLNDSGSLSRLRTPSPEVRSRGVGTTNLPLHQDEMSVCPSISSRKDSGIRSNSRRSSIQQQLLTMNGIMQGELLTHRVSGYYTSSQSTINDGHRPEHRKNLAQLPSPFTDDMGVCFQKLRKQSDLQLIRCVQDNSLSQRSYFVKAPLSKVSLFFKQPGLEQQFRKKAYKTFNSDAATLATARFNTYLDIAVCLLVMMVVTVTSLLHPAGVSTWWMSVACCLWLIMVAAVALCLHSLFCPSRPALSLKRCMSWQPWHYLGAILVSMPVVLVLSNTHTLANTHHHYSCLLYIGLIHFCNFTQLNCWMKSVLATLFSLLYIVACIPVASNSSCLTFPNLNSSSSNPPFVNDRIIHDKRLSSNSFNVDSSNPPFLNDRLIGNIHSDDRRLYSNSFNLDSLSSNPSKDQVPHNGPFLDEPKRDRQFSSTNQDAHNSQFWMNQRVTNSLLQTWIVQVEAHRFRDTTANDLHSTLNNPSIDEPKRDRSSKHFNMVSSSKSLPVFNDKELEDVEAKRDNSQSFSYNFNVDNSSKSLPFHNNRELADKNRKSPTYYSDKKLEDERSFVVENSKTDEKQSDVLNLLNRYQDDELKERNIEILSVFPPAEDKRIVKRSNDDSTLNDGKVSVGQPDLIENLSKSKEDLIKFADLEKGLAGDSSDLSGNIISFSSLVGNSIEPVASPLRDVSPIVEGSRVNASGDAEDCMEDKKQLLMETCLDVLLLVLLVWFLNRELEISYRLSWHGNAVAAKDRQRVQAMKDQADWLLHNIIPEHVVEQLKTTARYSQNVTNAGVLFASIVNFAEMYDESYLGGKECLRVLNELISDFDELLDCERFSMVEKIKTIGSTYMAASGLNPETREACASQQPNLHLYQLMEFAIALQQVINTFNRDLLEFNLIIRIGVNFGDVTAGVIGTSKLYYDIWGDAVNIASRMDSIGVAGRIQVPSHTLHVFSQWYEFAPRGPLYVKGKDLMHVYLLTGPKSNGVVPIVERRPSEGVTE
ncbi:LOW QUALITY PROTEIN: adenylate cyclase type 9 [Nilaparvata lugens]|uniref:LOW QUALITY PROTEIN: adenylate cyclase type 9 n=1 Tax=Nilaparvata lugens TaxID=108931 RepID=UPI00193E3B68|nr:LOW QUALITY PROTEIN: adenylate cyclase type 9 [Nilaparvata lugens]